MHRPSYLALLLLASVLLLFAACQTLRPASLPFESGPAPSPAAIQSSLDKLPRNQSRPFAMKLILSGREYAATGTLDFSDPYDFRITANTSAGPLFDVRYNWAGTKFLRLSPIMDKERITQIIADLSSAFRLPPKLDSLHLAGNTLILARIDADLDRYTWTFGPSSHLRSLDVDFTTFDTLEVKFPAYSSAHWPASITVYRFWRDYALYLNFMDTP